MLGVEWSSDCVGLGESIMRLMMGQDWHRDYGKTRHQNAPGFSQGVTTSPITIEPGV
jgi:hypothetical protein